MASKKNKQESKKVRLRSARHSSAAFLEPMAAQVVKKLPEGEEWLYEVKFDGYRALLIKDGTRVEIRSRKDNDLTRMYPSIAEAALRVHAGRIVIDG